MASPTRFASGTKTTNWRHTQSWSTQSYAMHTRSVLVRDGLTLHLSQLTQAATVHKTVEVLRKAAKAEAMQGALRGDARAAKRRAEELQNEIEKMCVGVWVGGCRPGVAADAVLGCGQVQHAGTSRVGCGRVPRCCDQNIRRHGSGRFGAEGRGLHARLLTSHPRYPPL